MNINNTMQADVLDILFANRNKSYGAYQLRKFYNKRLSTAIAVTLGMCLVFCLLYKLQAANRHVTSLTDLDPDMHLVEIAKDPQPILPPPVKIKPVEPIQVATVKVTTPKIVDDKLVTEPPPVQSDIENVKIDVANRAGTIYDRIAPPLEQSVGTSESLVKTEDYTKEFHTVQRMAQFPGGTEAWANFLRHNLRSEIPAESGAPAGSYTVNVSFLVDRNGNISEVKAISDPGYGAAAEAVRVIQRGPKWQPAEQNGRPVIYRQLQQITFVVATE